MTHNESLHGIGGNLPHLPMSSSVRRGQNKNAVPAERSALSLAHHALFGAKTEEKRIDKHK